MAVFEISVRKTLRYEGGLVDNPNDPGGLTNFGISLRAHPQLTSFQIRNLQESEAINIYQTQYWIPTYDRISDQFLADQLFDFGVTSGPPRAVAVLQSAILAAGRGGPQIDGIFGSATLDAVNKGGRFLRVNFTAERLKYYAALGKPEFLHSWFSRTIDSLTAA